MKDYYLVLGVSRSESPRGIRSAFRDLARRHHPDVAGPEHTPVFREIVEAYETLSDPEARRGHDEALRRSAPPLRGAEEARGLRVPKFEQAKPLVCDVLLSRAEAERGGVLPIGIPLLAPCAACHGDGFRAVFPCAACGARGWRMQETVLELAFPPGVRSGASLDVSLARLGVARLWLHVRVRVADA